MWLVLVARLQLLIYGLYGMSVGDLTTRRTTEKAGGPCRAVKEPSLIIWQSKEGISFIYLVPAVKPHFTIEARTRRYSVLFYKAVLACSRLTA